MAETAARVEKHTFWRRNSDGILTTVISVSSMTDFRPEVCHRAQRRTWTEVKNFLKKYELVRGDGGGA